MQTPTITREDYGETTHPLLAYARHHGLSIAEVADKLGISKGYAAQIMERWRAPSRDLICKIAETFKIDPVTLLNSPVRTYGSAYRPKKKRTAK